MLLVSCLLAPSSLQPSTPPSSFSCSSQGPGGVGEPGLCLSPSHFLSQGENWGSVGRAWTLSLLQGLELCRVAAVHVENLLSAREKQLTLPPSEITLL